VAGVSFVPFGGLANNVTFTSNPGRGTFIVVGTGPSLTVGVGQTVFGSVEASIMFDPTQVTGFREAIICAAPASEGSLAAVAAAATAGTGPQPMNLGSFAFQGYGGGSPLTLTLPVLVQNMASGTYNFGLCEEPSGSGTWSLVSTQGYFAVANTSPSN
jgi:hypothetical protein